MYNNNIIYPNFSNVSNTSLNTTISNENGVKVSTIEHLMGALFGLGIDNALIEIDNDEYFIDIVSGEIINVVSGQFLMRHWDLAIRASQATWSKFWQKYPEPGFHDIFAMNRFGHCKIEGNTKVLLSHIRFIKDVVSKPRFLGTGVSSNGKA